MIIPPGYMHIQHFFGGTSLPNGAAITYGIGAFGLGGVEEAAVQMHLDLSNNFRSIWTDEVALLETRAKAGPNSTGPFASHVETLVGTGAGEQMPPNVAYLIEKRTATGGRSGRGRLYMPGVAEDLVSGSGALNLTTVTAMQTRCTDWLADIETNATGMFLFHTASSDPTRVTNLTIDPFVATQRRRLR